MKAQLIEEYGDANQFVYKEIPKPKAANNQVLVKIKACSVNPIEWKIRSGALKWIYRIQLPAILGSDLSGTVDAVGKEVRSLKVGDAVYTCSPKKTGEAYAQWIALEETTVSVKPTSMNFKEAASVPLAAMTALQALRDKGGIQPGDQVLIIGASGGVGMFAVQIAKIFGAHVTSVCSTANVEFVKKLGSDEVIDYRQSSPFAGKQKYNIIFDCVAAHSYSRVKSNLTPNGIYISTLPSLSLLINSVITRFTTKKAKKILLKKNKVDLDQITQFIDEKKLKTHIDSEFNLENLALAHQRSESSKAVGKIIVSVEH